MLPLSLNLVMYVGLFHKSMLMPPDASRYGHICYTRLVCIEGRHYERVNECRSVLVGGATQI